MAYKFHTLDVFTKTAFSGNPLAVVQDADDLDDAQMQTIAREFNLSETVFVKRASNPAHTAGLRIFTPHHELPFAGHPTVGTAILLAELKYGTADEHEAIVVLEEGIGQVRVGVVIVPGEATYAEFDLPQLPKELGPPGDREGVARALGLSGSDIGFDNHRPTNFSAGVPFGVFPVRDRAALSRVLPMQGLWKSAKAGEPPHSGAFIYTRGEGGEGPDFSARMFAPGLGFNEDPATGGAVAAFAGALEKFEALGEGSHVFSIEQGADMGRPSEITLEMEFSGGKLDNARIGGNAVQISTGELLG